MTGVPIHSRSGLRIAALVTGLVLVGLLAVWGRALYGAYANYEQGMELLQNRVYVRAITYFDRSLHWYTPFSPYAERSARQLWKIGEAAEARNERNLALIAYRAIRRGYYAARSFYQPGRTWIDRSEEKIRKLASLPHAQERPSSSGKSGIPAKGRVEDPQALWSLAAVLGWFGWLGAVAGFIMAHWGPWRERHSFLGRRLWWAGAFFSFFAVWVVAMMQA